MDVESKQTLDDAVSRAQAAGDELVDRITARLNAAMLPAIAAAQKAADEIVDRASCEIDRTIAGLDGWTVTITIPPIVIRLNAPKSN